MTEKERKIIDCLRKGPGLGKADYFNSERWISVKTRKYNFPIYLSASLQYHVKDDTPK